jgi:hypothetical protein
MAGTLDAGADEPPNCSLSPDPNCLVGDSGPSFHRIDACSPGCSDGEVLDPADCDANNMAAGNIWCSPAHVGQVSLTTQYTTRSYHTPVNRVAKFTDNKYYGWLGAHSWEFDAQSENELLAGGFPVGDPSGSPGGSGSWAVSATPAALHPGEAVIGLYPMVIAGVPTLATAAQQSNTSAEGTWRSIKLNGNTNTWTSGNMAAVNFAFHNPGTVGGTIHTEVQYKNSVYWVAGGSQFGGNRSLFIYNAEQDTMVRRDLGVPETLRFPMDLCVFDNEVYLLAKVQNQIDSGRTDLAVYKVTSALEKVLVLETGINSNTDEHDGRNALYVDNFYGPKDYLYAINYMESQTGGTDGHGLWQIEKVNGQLVNNGRLPSNPNMPNGVDFQGGEEDDIWRVFTDSKRMSTSGGLPLWEFRSSSNRGADYSAYLFNGSGTTQTFWKNVEVHWIFSYAHERGPNMGARVANFGEVNMNITSYDESRANEGLLGINYELIPSFTDYPAGTPLAIRFLYDTKGHPHKNIATLESASSGTLTGDSRVLQTAISGVEFTAWWDFLADNLNPNQGVNLIGHVSTTGVT